MTKTGENFELKFQAKTSFEYSLKDLKSLFCGNYLSEEFYVQNLPWKIIFDIKKIDNVKHVNIFLDSIYEAKSDWECSVEWKMKLVNLSKTGNSKVKNKSTKFSKIKRFPFWSVYVPFKWLVDPKNGFVLKDSVTIMLNMTAEQPKNCDFTKEEFYYLLDKERENSEKAAAENIKMKIVSIYFCFRTIIMTDNFYITGTKNSETTIC